MSENTDELDITNQSDTLPAAETAAPKRSRRQKADAASPTDSILTVEAKGDIITQQTQADIAWHEIHSAYRTKKILTGILGGLEQMDSGKTIAVLEYSGFRVAIPLKEMVIGMPNDLHGKEYTNMILQYDKQLSNMLGCEIDFTIMGLDAKSRSIVASRADAMLRKRQQFYFEPNEKGEFRVYVGRKLMARIISVSEKAIRIEAFGVETSIMARDLSWDWIGDARDHYRVGDQVLVRVNAINKISLERISIKADIKSASEDRRDNLSLCRIQSKYVGKVADVYKGAVYIRLTNGVNAIAHSCYDRRTPGKKDDVVFVVTGIDEERGVALGIITRIIRQNL